MFKNKKGFTLIELLVVIAIIGTLSGIVLVSLGGARSRARDAVRQSDMRQVVSAQEMYYGINEAYITAAASDGTPAITGYLDALNDPQGATNPYKWLANDGSVATGCTTGEYFCAYAKLENPSASCSGDEFFACSEKGTSKTCTEPAYGVGDCVCW